MKNFTSLVIKKMRLKSLILLSLFSIVLCTVDCAGMGDDDTSVIDHKFSSGYTWHAEYYGANFTFWAPSIWIRNLSTYLWSSDQISVGIELHHIAADMLHIAKRLDKGDYDYKIGRKKKYDADEKYYVEIFKNITYRDEVEEWFQELNKCKNDVDQVEKRKIAYQEERMREHKERIAMKRAFVVMLSFYEYWDDIQKGVVGKSYEELRQKIDHYYQSNDDEINAFSDARSDRKLNLSGNLIYDFRDTWAYSMKPYRVQSYVYYPPPVAPPAPLTPCPNGKYDRRHAGCSIYGCVRGDPVNCQ